MRLWLIFSLENSSEFYTHVMKLWIVCNQHLSFNSIKYEYIITKNFKSEVEKLTDFLCFEWQHQMTNYHYYALKKTTYRRQIIIRWYTFVSNIHQQTQ
jgi:hypothetical protein